MLSNENKLEVVRDLAAEAMGVPKESMDPRKTFEELGFDSLAIVEVIIRFGDQIGVRLEGTELKASSRLSEVVGLGTGSTRG